MALKDDVGLLIDQYEGCKDTIKHNEVLFNIYEGKLLPYILADLREQLSPDSYAQAKHRVPPINILRRLIDKLSKIYVKPPVRKLAKDNPQDQKVFDYYMTEMDPNCYLGYANEFFNLHKGCFVEPYVDQGDPKLRIIPGDRFFVFSNDPVNPLRPTHYVKIMGKYQEGEKEGGVEHIMFYGYTDDEFLIFNEKGEILLDKMREVENGDGINIYGRIPGVYINRSHYDLIPKIDSDTLSMTKLIPLMLADLNYAAMFQSFSIIVGIDVDGENLKRGPNVMWCLKSDPSSKNAPTVTAIKPDVDIQVVMEMIKNQMALWLQSKGIKPGAMGELTVANAASGIAKAIDEIDTSEDRQKQVKFFEPAEKELWDLIFKNMHPIWMQDPDFEMRLAVSTDIEVQVTFPEQRPIVDTSKAIADQQSKITMGIQSKFGALKELYPDWDDDQIDAKLQEIADEKQGAMDAQAQQQQQDPAANQNQTQASGEPQGLTIPPNVDAAASNEANA